MPSIDRVLEATKDEEWQRFRKSLKGTLTEDKLKELWKFWTGFHVFDTVICDYDECDTCVQVDNYLKALARGGQLFAGVDLVSAVECRFDLPIKRN